MHPLINLLGIDFLIQMVGYFFAYSLQTEKFYDLTGKFRDIIKT